jgi:atypical dual specificity phosphatase
MLAEFRWILPGKLAGSARPGLLHPLEEDLRFLRRIGIGMVVTLTERPLPDRVREPGVGLEWIHFPIPDMGVPTPRTAAGLVERAIEAISRGRPVLVHCHAGMGRTGTMLACVLVSLGSTPEQAVLEVRKRHPGYIQSACQERFIVHYSEHVSVPQADPAGGTRPGAAAGAPGRSCPSGAR